MFSSVKWFVLKSCSTTVMLPQLCLLFNGVKGQEKAVNVDLLTVRLCEVGPERGPSSYPQESSPAGKGSWRRTRSSACGAGGRTCCGDTWCHLSLSSDPWTPGERPCTQSWVMSCCYRRRAKSPLWLHEASQSCAVIPKVFESRSRGEWRSAATVPCFCSCC